MYFTFIYAPNIQYQSNFFDSGHDFYFMKHVGITLAMLVVDVLTRWVMHKGIAVPVSIDVALTLIAALTLCSLLLRLCRLLLPLQRNRPLRSLKRIRRPAFLPLC